ncbi:MAG: 3-methyl-2-oxobutanoate hydroxymethyltransferase [Terriglobia bacterium]
MSTLPSARPGAGPFDSTQGKRETRKVTVPEILSKKSRRDKVTCLTAYDYPTARIVDAAGADMILVGDSLAMVVLGHENTLPVTMEEMLHHTRAVRRGTQRALLIADMPFGSYQLDLNDALANAVRFVKEAGAEAVKIEGGQKRLDLILKLVENDIPVMGHIGLTPQSIHALGGFKVQGKTLAAAEQLLRDARAVEAAGAFSVVLESIPAEVAERITAELSIPTIGIGAGPGCDGQVLVLHDLIGLSFGVEPKFARRYADLRAALGQAVGHFVADVIRGDFPGAAETYHLPPELREHWLAHHAR